MSVQQVALMHVYWSSWWVQAVARMLAACPQLAVRCVPALTPAKIEEAHSRLGKPHEMTGEVLLDGAGAAVLCERVLW